MDCFLYGDSHRHERVKRQFHKTVKHTQTIRRQLWFLGYKKCLAYELSCYVYSLNCRMKFESYIILYLFIKTSSFHYFHRLDWNILKWNRVDESLPCVL